MFPCYNMMNNNINNNNTKKSNDVRKCNESNTDALDNLNSNLNNKHSKYKNPGILFELLTKQITCDILNGKNDSFAKLLMFKYFNENTVLGKEFKLYNYILHTNIANQNKADRIIDVLLESRSRLNQKELNIQKYNLIKEIKENIDINTFLKSKIPNYKLYASIYKLFEYYSNSNTNDKIVDLINARETIVEYLMRDVSRKNTKHDASFDYFKTQPKEVKLLACKIALQTFNEKYKNLLPKQKLLLNKYITNVKTTNSLYEYVISEYSNISNQLANVISKVDNAVLRIKIQEVINQLSTIKPGIILDESKLIPLLNAYNLYDMIVCLNDNVNK